MRPRLVRRGRALHRRLAHHVVAERRERREEREVERRAAPRGGRRDTRESVSQSQVMPASSTSNGIASTLTRSRIATSRVGGPARRDADAAIAHHDAGDAVPGRGRDRAIPADLRVVVRVRVDEAGRDDAVGGVDHARGGLGDAADLRDPARVHRNVGVPPRRAAAVDDKAVLDQEVVCHACSALCHACRNARKACRFRRCRMVRRSLRWGAGRARGPRRHRGGPRKALTNARCPDEMRHDPRRRLARARVRPAANRGDLLRGGAAPP